MDVWMNGRSKQSVSRILRCSSWLCGRLCRPLCPRWCLFYLPQTSCGPLPAQPSLAAARWSTCEWEWSPCSAAVCAAPSSISKSWQIILWERNVRRMQHVTHACVHYYLLQRSLQEWTNTNIKKGRFGKYVFDRITETSFLDSNSFLVLFGGCWNLLPHPAYSAMWTPVSQHSPSKNTYTDRYTNTILYRKCPWLPVISTWPSLSCTCPFRQLLTSVPHN